jgi:Tfp pilus assembly protein PilN
MIRINLAERRRKFILADGAVAHSNTTMIRGLQLDQLKIIPWFKILLPLCVGYAVSYYSESVKQEEIQKLDESIAKLSAEESKIQASLAKVKSYDELKKSLEADEGVIMAKLKTIKTLTDNRDSIARLLFGFSVWMPKETFIKQLTVDPSSIKLTGESTGYTPISDLMKNLNESQYFSGVELVNSQQVRPQSEAVSFELLIKKK